MLGTESGLTRLAYSSIEETQDPVMANWTIEQIRELDASDPLRAFRLQFEMPPGIVYLDGNSLGALPKATLPRIRDVVACEWGNGLIGSWNRHDWINSSLTVGRKIAGLIGSPPDDVIVTDTTSVNLFRLALTALALNPGRNEILSEAGSFPTDLYVCEGAVRAFGRGSRLTVVPRDQITGAISQSTALVLLSHVHYTTGSIFPMTEITAAAHSRGAMILWDLSHSAGAVPVNLADSDADFAVGCGYKYLNGGPGAPSYLYVAKRLQQNATNFISGWHGHANPFSFVDDYTPAPGIRRFLTGTPSIIANAALETGVNILIEAGMDRIVKKSRMLTSLFIDLVDSYCAGYDLVLVSSRQAEHRGSQISFAHPQGYKIMQALISMSVIGDFRAPDILRFGFSPLYSRFEDAWIAVMTLREILRTGAWRDPRFAVRAAVT